MGLIITDANGNDLQEVDGCSLDLAFGTDENDFEVGGINTRLSRGSFIYIDGTEYGGIIDQEQVYTDRFGAHLKYFGRTWHGILQGSIVKPPSGQAHLTVSGTAESVISTIISNVGQTSLFEADTVPSGITIPSTQIPRYIGAYDALRGVLANANARLAMEKKPNGKVILSAVQSVTVSNEIDDDLITFDMLQLLTKVNHLVCLGQGTGTSRTVIDLYADAQGNISQIKTFSGKYEIAQVYENTNDDAAALLADGMQTLSDLQGDGEISVDISSQLDIGIGDSVEARNNQFGITVFASVVKKIVSYSRGILSVKYEVGTPTSWSEIYE